MKGGGGKGQASGAARMLTGRLLAPHVQVWGKTGSKLYGPKSGADYVDNHKRFSLFNKAAIEATRVLPFGFGEDVVFVANDWHSSLVPVLLKDVYQPKGQFTKAKVALCIHNIAFQGRMWEETFGEIQLPDASKAKFQFTDGIPKVRRHAGRAHRPRPHQGRTRSLCQRAQPSVCSPAMAGGDPFPITAPLLAAVLRRCTRRRTRCWRTRCPPRRAARTRRSTGSRPASWPPTSC